MNAILHVMALLYMTTRWLYNTVTQSLEQCMNLSTEILFKLHHKMLITAFSGFDYIHLIIFGASAQEMLPYIITYMTYTIHTVIPF